ncbi:hypothetical protein lilo_1447 [Lactococcus lactis subsp. lactis IO-1]|nr:hypothetical protein lilo_1447 [Lactococcus lactis subsp. lactis IO-1]
MIRKLKLFMLSMARGKQDFLENLKTWFNLLIMKKKVIDYHVIQFSTIMLLPKIYFIGIMI